MDFRPYSFTDKDGQPTGFAVELLKAVAVKMGLNIRITPGPWNHVWDELIAGRLDVLPVVARTPGREPLVDFSLPHTETFDAFFVRDGRPELPDLGAATGKEIIVLRSDAAHHELVERKFAGKVIPVESISDGLRLVAAGRHDAMLCSKLVGVLEREDADIKGVKSGPPIPDYKRVFSFAVKKGNGELLEKLNQGLMIVKTDGTYDRIYEKWLSADDPWRKYEKYLLPAGAGAITVALVVGIWLATLRRMVKARTGEVKKLNLELEQRVVERTEKLTESEAKYRNLFENMAEEVHFWRVVCDDQGAIKTWRLVDVNPPTLKTWGRNSVDEIRGKTTDEIFGPGAAEHYRHVVTKVMTEGVPYSFEDYFPNLDKHFRFTSVPFGEHFITTGTDITGIKKAELEIRESQATLQGFYNSAPFMMGIAELDGDKTVAISGNRAMAEFFAIRPEDLTGQAGIGLDNPAEFEGLWVENYRRSQREGTPVHFDYEYPRATGSCWLNATVTFIGIGPSGNPRFSFVVEDITARKMADAALQASLAEKEILLKELAHRTKNNMQVIAGLMSLQAATVSDEKLLNTLSDTQSRIRAMALVHEKLYRSGNFASLNFKDYAKELLDAILKAHHGFGGRVRTETNLDDVSVSIDAALPLGLILNELVSNSLKHAFPDGKSGAIFFLLKARGEGMEMRYRDDGPGLPRDLDPSRIESLGLRLVYNLAVKQLRGTMEHRHEPAPEFVFVFDGFSHLKRT